MKKNYKQILSAAFLLLSFTPVLQAQQFNQAHQIGGAGNDYGRAIDTDNSGNVYVTGFFSGTADFDPGPAVLNLTSAGSNDIFIQKTDASGNLLWAKTLGSGTSDASYSLEISNQGDIYISGRFEGTVDFDPGTGVANLTSAGVGDAFVLKLTSAGNFVWARNWGGAVTDQALNLATGPSGEVFATGTFNGTADLDPGAGTYSVTSAGGEDIFIVKLNSAGAFEWATAMGGTANDRGYSIATDNGGNVYTTGVYSGTIDFDPGTGTTSLTSVSANFDFFIQKLSSAGTFLWAKSAGGTSLDYGWDITIDEWNNIYTTGYFQGTADLDPGASIFNLTSAGNYDVFIQKLNAAGDFVWARAMGGASDDRGYSIATDNLGGVYTSGYFINSADFDPAAANFTLTSAGNADFFIQKMDSAGILDWAINMGGVNHDFALGLNIGQDYKIYTTGNFEGTADFDPSPSASFSLTPGGTSDAFVSRLSQCFTLDTISISSCGTYMSPSGSHAWTASGTYLDVIQNAANCDSIITIHLTILNSSDSAITATACGNYTSPSGNYNWTSSGTYTDTLQNSAGCDSLITVQLTVLAGSASTINATTCNYYISPSGNYIWTASGIYTDTISNAAGCDSIITINLTKHPVYSMQAGATICQGDSILLGGAMQTQPGIYTDNFTTQFGCDSIVTTTLMVTQISGLVNQNGSTLTAAVSGAGYQWVDCGNNFLPIPGATGQSFTPLFTGAYAVEITQNGCSVTSACTQVTITAAAENVAASVLSVYPNPATTETILRFSEYFEPQKISLVTAAGKTLQEFQVTNKKEVKLSLRGVPSGVYFIKAEAKTGVTIQKLIIQ